MWAYMPFDSNQNWKEWYINMAKSGRKQKKSSAGKNLAVFFIVFVILEALIILGIRYVFKDANSCPKLGGYSFFVMDSANMEKDIPRDALVIAENGTPSIDKRGFAVVAKNVGKEGTTVAWLYDIGSKGDTVDGVVYTVYQESAPDKMYDLDSSDIVGITSSYYITAGKIISFVTTPFGMIVSLAAPIVLLIFLELIISIASRSRFDEYDYDEEDLEEQVRRRRAEKEGVTLDDFLYGGQEDDVYGVEKPKEDYREEFEDKYSSLLDRKQAQPEAEDISAFAPETEEAAPAPAEKPDFMAAPAPAPYPAEQTEVQPVQKDQPEVKPVEEAPVQQAVPAPAPQAAPVQQTAPAQENAGGDYYERASRMIDDAVQEKMNTRDFEAINTAQAQQPAPAPQAAPVQEAPAQQAAPAPAHRPRPAERPDGQMQRPQQRRRRPAGQRPAGARPQQRRRPAGARPIPPHQDANATLEQLMKLMEAEQQKLRDQSGNDQ